MTDDSIATITPHPQLQEQTVQQEGEPQKALSEETLSQNKAAAEPHRMHHRIVADTVATPHGSIAEPQQRESEAADSRQWAFKPLPFGQEADSTDTYAILSEPAQGEGGDPTTYSSSRDSSIGGLCILCFLLIIYALSSARSQIMNITRGIFDTTHRRDMAIMSLPEMRYLFLLLFCTAIEQGLLFFSFSNDDIDDIALPTIAVVGIYAAIYIAFIAAKAFVYVFVNWVFFHRDQNSAWIDVFVYINAATGIILFPLMLIQIYAPMQRETAVWIVVAAIGATKLISMCKAHDIFFPRYPITLHLLLYIFTFEILPIGALIKAWQLCQTMIIAEI